jgi:hypothetical protein
LAGAQTPAVCEGTDVWPMISGQTDRVQDEAFIEIRNDATIVTDDWKMTVQIAPWHPSDRPMMGGELYDRTADPDEMTNLFDVPAYAEIQASLRTRLVAFDPRLDSLLDSGPALEPLPQPDVYTFSQGEMCDRDSVRQPPHQPKRNMSVELVLPAVRPEMSGVLFAAGSYRYGYTLRLEGGKLTFATQRWEHAPVVLEAPLASSDTPTTISASWRLDGSIALCVDGQPVATGNAGGEMIPTVGLEIRSTAGQVCVGCAKGPRGDRIPQLSETEESDTFTGTITSATLRLEE